MPVYPGTELPALKQANSYEKGGFKESLLCLYSHTGTHVDPPAHLFADRTTLDALPIEQFADRALVVNCTHLAEGEDITMTELAQTGMEKSSLQISCSFTSAGTNAGVPTAISATIPALTMPSWISFSAPTKKGSASM